MPPATNTSRRFTISLALILVSFVLLFFISYQSLIFQDQVLSGQNRSEKLGRIDRISSDFFSRLANAPVPGSAVPIPIARPAFPLLRVPDSSKAREIFMQIAFLPDQRQAILIDAELNSSSEEKQFWQNLLINEFFKNGSYFEMRQAAAQILESNFDCLLEYGITLKCAAALKVAESFLHENNPEAARQWLTRLRHLPAPVAVPTQPQEWISRPLPADLQSWLLFLFNCYKLSYSENVETGWYGEKDHDVLIIEHKDGLYAFPAGLVISALQQRLAENGFADVPRPAPGGLTAAAHALSGARGLKILLPETTARIPGGFLLLLLLTSLGTAGLFIFALHEWQTLQKARLLDEEEQFFRQTAHDLKTPITTVSFLAETLALKRYRDEEQCNRYLNQLQTETQKAAELFDRLLLSVRLRKKTTGAAPTSISLPETLDSLLQRFKTRLPGWEIIEEYQATEAIIADPDMFERLMINLLENVIRHAAAGRQLVLRTCRTQVNGCAEIALMVGDRGSNFPVTIDSDKLDLLKNSLPYSPERGGSGTGLFLVRQIMQTHGGQLYASRREDGGIWMVTTWRIADEQNSGN
ncbi:MAG: HAMP domain-containing histidine kinase [Candidatus Riflebacteria bacterium]|nr:HAMP domain-containing histidine kinase [Candidatus Riflebacteria bacterium]